MMKRIVQLLLAFTGGVLGYLFIADLTYLSLGIVGLDSLPGWLVNNYTGALAGALILYLLFFWSVDPIVRFIQLLEDKLMNFPVADLIFGTVGLVVGLLLAFLVTVAVNNIEIAFISAIVPIFLTLLLGYLGFQVGYKKKDELLGVFRQSKEDKNADQANADEADARLPVPKLLDTSVIIDGRIADICQTGFLEGKLVIPNFVLEELQHIADSSDSLKRNRGRRGLDILKRIQQEIPIEVEITDEDFDEIQEVDSKLVKLAKKTNGLVVTNDFNLNKVCDLQGVSVLNINDLANAVKPVVLPGEEMAIQIIKDGKEQNQGIGYLDDGTMIVVEGGRNAIGKTINVIVTSVLQTSAGRMIFAKPKSMDKAQ